MEGNLIDRIENKELTDLLNKIKEDPAEENMIALLKCAAGSTFLVPVTGQLQFPCDLRQGFQKIHSRLF